MNYKFPVIENIEQIREAIQGRTEFVEHNRGTHIVFTYHVSLEDSFPPIKTAGGSAKMREQAELNKALRRECRGLIFSPEGKILSRRFHKFFNLNEREETLHNKIDWNQDYHILEKLDGSMLTPLDLPDGLYWATKAGVTDIGELCNRYVKKNTRYIDFSKNLIADNYTPIFEYMSPFNRVVIDHKEEKLILLAIRHNITGQYISYGNMLALASNYDIPVVKPLETYYLLNINQLQESEGIVVRFNDGHMVKVKTDWYVRIHKAKDNLLFEKNVIKLILEEKIDDIIPHLTDDDRNKIITYKEKLLDSIEFHSFAIKKHLAYHERTLSRKDFALWMAPKLDPMYREIMFKCWQNDKYDIRDEVIQYILKNTGSQTQVDTIRRITEVTWNANRN